MANLTVKNNATPFEKLNASTPANFVKDNPAVAATATVAGSVIAYNVADHSQLAATMIKKGLPPAQHRSGWRHLGARCLQ